MAIFVQVYRILCHIWTVCLDSLFTMFSDTCRGVLMSDFCIFLLLFSFHSRSEHFLWKQEYGYINFPLLAHFKKTCLFKLFFSFISLVSYLHCGLRKNKLFLVVSFGVTYWWRMCQCLSMNCMNYVKIINFLNVLSTHLPSDRTQFKPEK